MKNLSFKKSALTLLAGVTISLGIINCGGGGSDSTASAGSGTTNSYTGAGSKWDITLNANNTFEITHRDTATSPIDREINGTFNILDSSFRKMTVTSVSGANAPSVGDTAYGLEVPGYAFFLRPSEDSGEVITMIQAGNCPSGDFSGNWITARNLHDFNDSSKVGTSQDASDAGSDVFGTFSWTDTNSSLNILTQYSLAAPTTDLNSPNSMSVTCQDGVAALGNATMYLTANGGAIVHVVNPQVGGLTDESIITAFAAENIATKAVFSGDYAGILMNADVSDRDSIQPLAVTCDTNGTCIGNTIDPDSGANTGTAATLTLNGTLNAPSNGFISGTIDVGGATGAVTCMLDSDAASSGKNLISCSGQDPADNTQLFNILLVTK